MMRAKVIEVKREGLTAKELEDIINDFIEKENPSNIISFNFSESYPYLIIIYVKG
jgi:ssRNA-specific RNase YbeY (16S rRNA maturation enzyme)